MESDSCYFRRRADEEFAAARSAACGLSRAAHFELGERYAQFAAVIDAVNEQIDPPPSGMMEPRHAPLIQRKEKAGAAVPPRPEV